MSALKELVRKVPTEAIVSLDFDLTKSGSRYYRGVKHNSLVIDTKTNTFHWNSLDVHGSALDWLLKVKGMAMSEAIKVLQEHTGIPFQQNFESLFEPRYPYHKLANAFWKIGDAHRGYWYSRGYSDLTIDNFELGYTGRHYVIPVRHEGTLVNFQCIVPPSPGKDKQVWNWTRGLGKQPFNFKALHDTDWVIITESPVDAILAHQHGYPAISVMPNALNWNKDFTGYLSHIKTIYLMFDNDLPGTRGLRKTGRNFQGRARVVDWDGYADKVDVGDVLTMRNGEERMDWLLRDSLPYDALKNDTNWTWYQMLRGRMADE